MSAAGVGPRSVGALALALGAATASAQGELARSVSRDLPDDLRAADVLTADLDGDGLADLLVGCDARQPGPSAAGALLVLRAQRDGTLGPPLRLDLTPDVVAWGLGDVHPDAGAELVLFGAASVLAWRPRAPEAERFVRLTGCDFLWQLPAAEGAFLYAAGVRDVDGDGLDDLVCPEPGGWRVALQRRSQGPPASAGFELQHVLRLPREAPPEGDGERTSPDAGGDRRALSIRLGGEEASLLDATLLSLFESVPAPQWVDWDGDRTLDLVAQSASRLYVWRQAPAGTFASEPSGSFPLAVVADRKRRLDASYRAIAQDLDRDRRADIVVFAGDSRSSDVRTQVLAFLSAGLEAGAQPRNPFGERGVPQDLLVLAGFVASAEFVDVDGDGLPELIVHTVRPDLIDQLRSAASETIDAEMFVYPNVRGRLARKPVLAWRYTLPLKDFVPLVDFVGDVTGDGLSELVVRDQPGRVRLYMLRAAGPGWTLVERPLWEGGLDAQARVETQAVPGRGLRDVLTVEEGRVTRVRLGR